MHSTPYISAMVAILSASVIPPHFMSLIFTKSAAPICRIFIASRGLNTDSSASTGTKLRSVTYFNPSRSWAFTGCSTSSMSRPLSCIPFRMRTASLGVQAWLASMRSTVSLGTAARMAARRSTSKAGFTPTFTLMQSKPRWMAI